VTNSLAPALKQKFWTNNGTPAAGYKVFTYAAGTDTKLDTYQSPNGARNSNPITLDFRGEASIWLPPNVAYKFVYSPPNDTDPPTSPIWSVDDVVDSQIVTLWGGVDTGSINAYVLDFTANFTSYRDGIVIFWIPSNSNAGGAATINVNGLGPVSILNPDGSALVPGEMVQNQIAAIVYRSGIFYLISASWVLSTGTFALALSGFATPLVGDVSYVRSGNLVTLRCTFPITGTSNSTSMQGTGVPLILRPDSGVRSALCSNIFNNAIGDRFGKAVISPLGEITFELYDGSSFNSAAFTGSNTKGIGADWQIMYTL